MTALPLPEERRRLIDATTLERTLLRLAHEVRERHPQTDRLLLVAIRDGGVPVAHALAATLEGMACGRPATLALDVTAWRDDRPRPAVPGPDALVPLDGDLPCLDGAEVVVVDDVLHTGRTLRAALDALAAHGRPASVEALVLVDRGHRELPLRATFVGRNLPVAAGEWVDVVLEPGRPPGAWLEPRP